MNELEGLLAALGSEGVLDSQGRFHLDPARARQKLKVFQEALPAFAVLRMVQGLHLAGADRIEVRLDRGKLEVEASFAEPSLSLEELRASFRGEAGLGNSAADLVATGLNAVLLEQPEGLSCSVTDAQGNRRWDLLEDQIQAESSGSTRFRLLLQEKFRAGFLGWGGRRRRALLYREIQQRCRFSPCTFVLDGRRFDNDWECYIGDEGSVTIGPVIEFLKPGTGFAFHVGDLSAYSEVEPGVQVWTRLEPQPLGRYRTGFFPTQIYAGLPSGFEGSSMRCSMALSCFELAPPGDGDKGRRFCRVSLVRHGVVCETFEKEGGLPHTYLLLDASHLASDLSGLNTVRDEAFERLWQETLEAMRQAARWMIAHLELSLRGTLQSALPGFAMRGQGAMAAMMRNLGSGMLSKAVDSTNSQARLAHHVGALKAWLEQNAPTH